MASATGSLSDLEQKAGAGAHFTRSDAERLLASVDLIAIGMVGQAARQHRSRDDVTFLRVAVVSGGVVPDDRGEPGEVRIAGVPHVIEDAVASVRVAHAFAAGVPVTGYSARDVVDLGGHDRRALVDVASKLAAAGLESVAEFPVDAFDTTDEAVDVAKALERGGLGVWRLTVDHAPLADRLTLIQRAMDISAALRTVRAFAPLPRRDPADTPSTGYDDVRTIAVARAVCHDIRSIQVDWPLYGPKLAQVAITYGANDIDGISPVDSSGLGARRAPKEDIMRQIRAAGGVPVERNGRDERRS